MTLLKGPSEWLKTGAPEGKTLTLRERRNILLANSFEKIPNMPERLLFQEMRKGGTFAEHSYGESDPVKHPTANLFAFRIGSTNIYEVFVRDPSMQTKLIINTKTNTDSILDRAA